MNIGTILSKVQQAFTATLFTVNETKISLTHLFIFIIVLLSFVLLARFISRFLMKKFLSRLKMEVGIQYTLRRITEYITITMGAIIAFQFIGIDLSGLAVIFGLLSVGIGFGLQNVTSNFVAGLILLFERPIKIGDRVTIGDVEGDVEEINMRSTTIRTLNNISIIVPNSDFISSKVINWSHSDPKVRIDIDIGVSYNSNLDDVLLTLKNVALENSDVLHNPEPEVIFKEFGDSSWNLRLRIWLLNPKRHHYVRSDINCAIVRKFRENKIEIPFPQRDLHFRTSLPKGERP